MTRRTRQREAILIATFLIIGAAAPGARAETATQAATAPVEIETEYLRYAVSADGTGLHFIDKHSGAEYCSREPATPWLSLRQGGRTYGASAVERTGDRVRVTFGAAGLEVVLRITSRPRYFILEVVSASAEDAEALTFADMRLTLKGTLEEAFSGCALALNLQTNVPELPGPNGRLRALCYPRFGMVGARVAIVGAPTGELRGVLQEVVADAPELPHSPLGGPWALDAPINRGSYLFNFGDLSEKTVGQWVELAKRLGMNQIDFHGGGSFRFGDIRPNPQTYPEGTASLKAVIDKLHEADIAAGLHTYAFFLDKRSKWVSPVPDPRLGKDATFTLAEDLTADATAVPVAESTERMSTTTGFFVMNSVTLQIDDELITYSEIDKQPPYAFTQCQRGAWGTKAAPHDRGAKVHHLKEMFGLFVPDGDSTLFTEVAARTAEVFNECGFDMMYLDALDGEGILGGGEAGWHYGSKFVFEIWKHLERPALMEMSTFHHHLWYVRSRYVAWDHPNRGYKDFVDIHCAANRESARMFLPGHLGWWAVKTWNGSKVEPTYADDIEYLCCKCLATDAGFSLMGVDPGTIRDTPVFQRLGAITRRYEALRHEGRVPESIKAVLARPGQAFTLCDQEGGGYQFRPVAYAKQTVDGLGEGRNTWEIRNAYGRQPVQLRIEALMSVAPYDSSEGVEVADLSRPAEFTERSAAPGVRIDLQRSTAAVKAGDASGCLTGSHNRARRAGTWASVGKHFAAPRDLSKQQALGVWIHGDGQGEVLNFQLRCPAHIVAGVGEHYVPVDFEGWRYFELVEPEGDRCDEFIWPYSGSAYLLYRELVDYRQVSAIRVWYNNLPPGKTATCYLSPVRALPARRVELHNPAVSVNGATILFPVTMASGSYLELRSGGECKLYGAKGELLADVKPRGEIPFLNEGANRIEFRCDPLADVSPRARVCIISEGKPLRPAGER
jgi:hypothetical protein